MKSVTATCARLVGSMAMAGAGPGYPPSRVISGIDFDWLTHVCCAPGSDNWPVTWADDDYQYTAWGDGGGFGGTNSDGRVSNGFGRIEGSKGRYVGVNIAGGKSGPSPAPFTGKCYGIICADGRLYAWRTGDGSNDTAYRFQELWKSADHGRTWKPAGVRFTQNDFRGSDKGFFLPTFLQFGKNYAGARDEFVYTYAPDLQDVSGWKVQKPGRITLLRMPIHKIANRPAYKFFAGSDAKGKATWTSRPELRKPVFEDSVNGVMRTSAAYNAGLGRYFLIVEHTGRAKGNIGIYDGPEPWGPWTTVLFERRWGAGHIEASTFFWNFSTKWWGADGCKFVLVFTGSGSNDSWNTVEGSFTVPDLAGRPGHR